MCNRCTFLVVIIFVHFIAPVGGDGQYEVTESASNGKLHIEFIFETIMNGLSSISDAEFLENSLCQEGHPNFDCQSSSSSNEKILDLNWVGSNTSIWRKSDFSATSYEFNVSTANIQIGLKRNAAGDELNVTLTCEKSQRDVFVDGYSKKSNSVKLQNVKVDSMWLDALFPKYNPTVSFHCGGEDEVLETSALHIGSKSTTTVLVVFLAILAVVVIMLLIVTVVLALRMKRISRLNTSERTTFDNPMSFSVLNNEDNDQRESGASGGTDQSVGSSETAEIMEHTYINMKI